MIFGMTTFTFVHVLISLVGIAIGMIVMYGLTANRRMAGLTLVFLAFTVLTSVTGFLFPIHGPTPALAVGGVSMVVLVAAIAARYGFHLRGPWRWVYAAGAVAAQWFNVFVLIVQSFAKVPALHALAPKGSEPPFAIVQGVVLLAFIVIGALAVRRFRPVEAAPAMGGVSLA